MSLRDEITQVRVKHFIEKENEFEFPAFLKGIRKTLGVTRKVLSVELGVHLMKIFYLEEGRFKRFPELSLLSSLSEYYGIPSDLLIDKAKKYVSEREKIA